MGLVNKDSFRLGYCNSESSSILLYCIQDIMRSLFAVGVTKGSPQFDLKKNPISVRKYVTFDIVIYFYKHNCSLLYHRRSLESVYYQTQFIAFHLPC